jgi:hypothetical protein
MPLFLQPSSPIVSNFKYARTPDQGMYADSVPQQGSFSSRHASLSATSPQQQGSFSSRPSAGAAYDASRGHLDLRAAGLDSRQRRGASLGAISSPHQQGSFSAEKARESLRTTSQQREESTRGTFSREGSFSARDVSASPTAPHAANASRGLARMRDGRWVEPRLRSQGSVDAYDPRDLQIDGTSRD